MKQRTKYGIGITSIVLAGTLGLGAVAYAGEGDDADGGRRRHPRLTDEQKCEREEQIITKALAAQARIDDKIANLTEKLAAAQAAGETDKVARIEKALRWLEKLSDRVEVRLAAFRAWAAENCD